MDRETAKEYIKQNISCTEYLQPAPNRGSYCCPLCDSGTRGTKDSDGAVKFYEDTNTWYCHACRNGKINGKRGDIITLYQLETGTDYNTALTELAARAGISIDGTTERPQSDYKRANDRQPQKSEKTPQNEKQSPAADFTAYYQFCRAMLNEPAAVSYLQARGISTATAAACGIGYDPAADPAAAPGATTDAGKRHPAPRIIAPCTADYYANRSMDQNTPTKYKSINPTGSHTQLFNAAAIYNNDVVFVVEGFIDALSFIEAGAAAIALNGKGNGPLLLKQLQERPAQASFIICHDNDSPEKAADTMRRANELNDALQAMNYNSIVYNVAGIYHDANDALQNNRAAFIAAIREARAALLPGLLTPAAAIKILKDVDDEYLTLPHFNRFSQTAKLKRHDTVVIAADTGAGKSSLALNFLYDLQDRYPALYINLEMDEATILQRLVAIHTGMDLDRIEGYKHDQQTRADVDAALNQILSRKEIQLITDAYDLETIEKQVKLATHGRQEPTLVFIDTALLVTAGSKTASRYERFTHISEELRRISRLNNIIMFVLLQQNRDGKNDEKKRPTNSSLKESGSWENDATKIVFLWYNPETEKKELIITKNRSGINGVIELNYSPHTQTYRESRNALLDKETNKKTPINRI